MKAASPRVTSYHLTHSLVSELLHLVSLPSWPLTLIRAKFAPFSLSFLTHHFPLLSPEISLLLLSLSSPACVLPTQDSGRQTAPESLLSACETCSLWPGLAHPDERGRDSPHTGETLVSPRWEIYKNDSGSDLMLCSGWKSYHPSTLICTFLPPREAPREQAEAADFY